MEIPSIGILLKLCLGICIESHTSTFPTVRFLRRFLLPSSSVKSNHLTSSVLYQTSAINWIVLYHLMSSSTERRAGGLEECTKQFPIMTNGSGMRTAKVSKLPVSLSGVHRSEARDTSSCQRRWD
ncbi:hypothetical protein VTK73DRAFT_4881 [Phialemonium thermophilum]|uniref:Secreted protein n=1 Tax=Phialemonium thermophilum TaxID=223376 RepID=A0ABR3V569_9PEZI